MGLTTWRRLRIGTQLIAGFGLVLGTMAVVLGLALTSFGQLGRADEQRETASRRIELVQALLLDVVNMETGLRGFVASGKEPFLEPFTQGRQRYAQHLDEAKTALAGQTAQLERLQRLADAATAFAEVADKLIAARRDATQLMSGTEELVAQFSEGRDKKATDAIREEAKAIEQAEKALQHTLAEQSASLRRTTTFVMTAGGLVALAFGVVLAVGLARAIGRPLAQAVEASRRIATGDLTVLLDARRDDEIGALLRSLHEMQQSLQQAVHGVRENAERVARSSSGIAEGNGALRDRTDAQAASLQQATASVSQLHQTVQRNEADAVQARQLALSASQVAARGGQVVSEVVATMQGISEASRRIADITGVIDGIAFQTNILALNAAVEAARAGEQGPRLRRRRRRGAHAGAALGGGGPRDQAVDRHQRRAGRAGLDAGRPGRRHHARDRAGHRAGERHRAGDQRLQPHAGRGPGPGQPGGDRHGPQHPRERQPGAAQRRGGGQPVAAGAGAGAGGRGVPAARRREMKPPGARGTGHHPRRGRSAGLGQPGAG
ncbi:CHASE3 domain-containing protein [Aquabacterium sp. J223]|nr:CHASE3 domain-containing protein [Aquabacterium sp. J223]UUX96902.1 CHASE3 domain-containing protein [Aquabacterium sp. J223]